MAEDQGVNGDRWTEQASNLLMKLGWIKIADSNIDIPGSDGHMHGIDALFKYVDGYSDLEQGVFLEAKRYQTTSFRDGKIQDWVTTLNRKIRELRFSEGFQLTYPEIAETSANNGLLMMWFHDKENYETFKPKLKVAMQSLQIPRASSSASNRLIIFSNEEIMRLASLADAKMRWEDQRKDLLVHPLNFYYPSSLVRVPTRSLSSLCIEYMLSKIVVAKAVGLDGNAQLPYYVIFYFGEVDIRSFMTLRASLLSHNMISDGPCHINLYCSKRNDELRKIIPDIRRHFTFGEAVRFEIASMDVFADLPGWMDESAM